MPNIPFYTGPPHGFTTAEALAKGKSEGQIAGVQNFADYAKRSKLQEARAGYGMEQQVQSQGFQAQQQQDLSDRQNALTIYQSWMGAPTEMANELRDQLTAPGSRWAEMATAAGLPVELPFREDSAADLAAEQREAAKAAADIAESKARTGLMGAQEAWHEARPGIEAGKIAQEDAEEDRKRALKLRTEQLSGSIRTKVAKNTSEQHQIKSELMRVFGKTDMVAYRDWTPDMIGPNDMGTLDAGKVYRVQSLLDRWRELKTEQAYLDVSSSEGAAAIYAMYMRRFLEDAIRYYKDRSGKDPSDEWVRRAIEKFEQREDWMQ